MLDAGLCIKLITFVGGCVSVPLITTTLIESGWKTNRETEKFTVTEKGEKIGPIFNCNHNSKNYKVYLFLNKKGLTGKDITEKNITLQVIEKEEEGKETIVWGPESKVGEKWDKWEIQVLQDDSAHILLQDTNKSGGYGGTATCSKETNKVYPWRNTQYKKFLRVENGKEEEKVEFKLGLCETKDDIKECEIKFNEHSPFSWNNFNPKITIPLEKQ